MPHLTDAMIRRLAPPASGMSITWDDDVTGLGIRITKSGHRAFIMNYRTSGRQRQLTIGDFGPWSTSQARERARELRRAIDVGEDPWGDRQQALAAPTVNDLARYYIEQHLPRKRPSSQTIDHAFLKNRILPDLGNRKVAAVTHSDIAALHRRIKAPIVANRVLALANTMFNLAIKLEWIDRNPCKGVEKHREHPRQRYLSGDEIVRLMAALDSHPGQSANAIRLLLLTGARRSEVLSATWDQFNLDGGIWIKPHQSTKQKALHRIPLGQAALDILRQMKVEADAYIADAKTHGRIARIDPHVFPGVKPNQPRSSINKYWTAVCLAAQIQGCRVHDLRHSFASILASSGASLPLIGQLLGHSQPGTTARYSHLYDAALREAANSVGDAVTSAKPVIVPLPRKAT